jgi:pimeloyl-ACP methyl ester carboxylesterase
VTTFRSYDGLELAYRSAGDGPPLVCLAGGPGADVRELADLATGLGRYRTLVLLDARASGRSPVAVDQASCAFTAQARDIEALRAHLGADRIDLLGHSAGTLTVQEYAALSPGRVGKLVLVTPAGRAAREPDPVESAAIRALGVATASPDCSGHVDPPGWLRAAFYASGSTDPARLARLAAVTVPVLVVAGAADGIAGTAPARLVAGTYPDARLAVLPGCGHYPWLDDPAAFATVVTEFLS